MGSKSDKADNFVRHLEPLQSALEAYCRRSLIDKNAVGDTLQNSVAKAFRDFHLYAEGTNFRAWIFRYLYLEILNANRAYLRYAAEPIRGDFEARESDSFRVEESLLEKLLDDPDAILDQFDEELSGAIRDLAEQERTALLLHSVGEFKYREIAEIVEVPIGTVMSSLARARLRLRHRLIAYGLQKGLLSPKDHG